MDCKTAQSFVIPYINNQLSDSQTEAFLRHIFQCRECFEEMEIFYTVHFALQKLEEDEHVSYNMRDMLWNDLKAAEKRIIRRKLIHYFSCAVMLAAEFLLVLMLVGSFGSWKMYENTVLETEAQTETGVQPDDEAQTETGMQPDNEAQTENGTQAETETETGAVSETEAATGENARKGKQGSSHE